MKQRRKTASLYIIYCWGTLKSNIYTNIYYKQRNTKIAIILKNYPQWQFRPCERAVYRRCQRKRYKNFAQTLVSCFRKKRITKWKKIAEKKIESSRLILSNFFIFCLATPQKIFLLLACIIAPSVPALVPVHHMYNTRSSVLRSVRGTFICEHTGGTHISHHTYMGYI